MSTSPTDAPTAAPNEGNLDTQILNALIGHIKQSISLYDQQGYIRPIAIIDSSRPSTLIQLLPPEVRWIEYPGQILHWAYCIAAYRSVDYLYGQVPDDRIYSGMRLDDLMQTLYPEGYSELEKNLINQRLEALESAGNLTVHDGLISLSREAVKRDPNLLMIQNNPIYKDINPDRENLMQATKQFILESIVQEARKIYDIPEGHDLEIQLVHVYKEDVEGNLTLTFADASSCTCSPHGRSYVVGTGECPRQFAGFYKNGILDLLHKDGNGQLTNLAKTCIEEMIADGSLISSVSEHGPFIPSPAALSGIPGVRVISTGNPRAVVYHPDYPDKFKVHSLQ